MRLLKLFYSLPLTGALALAGCQSGGQAFLGTTGGAAVSLSSTSVAFGPVPLGQTSSAQSVTLTNTGAGIGLAVSAVRLAGATPAAFLATSACPSSVVRGASCNVSVAYSPTASGTQTATLVIVDNAGNSPQLVTLSGNGTSSSPVVSLSASALTFARVPVGQASTQTVTVNNIGSQPLNLAGFTVGGPNATSFAVSGACVTTATVSTGGSCFLTITYAPTVNGALSAVVNINDNAPNTPQIISLSSN